MPMPGAIEEYLRRGVAEQTTGAYFAWWQECAMVHDAYRSWLAAAPHDAAQAYAEYVAALENEQRAAEAYAAQAGRR